MQQKIKFKLTFKKEFYFYEKSLEICEKIIERRISRRKDKTNVKLL